MKTAMDKIGFIVATKDRPHALRNLLGSLSSQSYPADEIIIVDGGLESVEEICREFSHLPVVYAAYHPPSAVRQRNFGLQRADLRMSLIGFLDDDIVLDPDAVRTMLEFWEQAPPEVGGVAFNLVNHPNLFAARLKTSTLARKLGLYDDRGGRVLASGFQTMIGTVRENTYVEWVPMVAVWRRQIFQEFQFDAGFGGYSYLEDLDFSYRVGEKYKLVVVADAYYSHFPAPSGRGNDFAFGRREVKNRLHFVRKNRELSLIWCYAALFLRMAISFVLFVRERKRGYFDRAMGNALELSQALLNI